MRIASCSTPAPRTNSVPVDSLADARQDAQSSRLRSPASTPAIFVDLPKRVCFHVFVTAKAFDRCPGGRQRSLLTLNVVAEARQLHSCFTREKQRCFEAHIRRGLHAALARGSLVYC